MRYSALMLRWNTIRRQVVGHLESLQLLHQLLLDLLLGHVLKSLNDYIGHRLLMLRRLTDVVPGIDVLTDGDASSLWRCLFCLLVVGGGLVHLWLLAMRLRLGLRLRSSCAIGLRVIIIVDVDIVIINYLNNFA